MKKILEIQYHLSQKILFQLCCNWRAVYIKFAVLPTKKV